MPLSQDGLVAYALPTYLGLTLSLGILFLEFWIVISHSPTFLFTTDTDMSCTDLHSVSLLDPLTLARDFETIHEDTSYRSPSADNNDYEDISKPVIRLPQRAKTTSPIAYERTARVSSFHEELTPPGTPIQDTALPGLAQSAFGVKFAPAILSRAGSLLNTGSLISPVRAEGLGFPRKADPDSSRNSVESAQSSPSRKNRASKGSFANLFDFQGVSAPLTIGISASPKKESFPAESPFGPIRSEANLTRRPTHNRQGSKLQSAASFLGLASGRSGSVSPARSQFDDALPIQNMSTDEILCMNVENELLPEGRPQVITADSFDELLTSSQKLFSRFKVVYAEKDDEVHCLKRESKARTEEAEEARMSSSYLKQQLQEMAQRAESNEKEVSRLLSELDKERCARERSIRLVDNEVNSLQHGTFPRPVRSRNINSHLDVTTAADEDSSDDSTAEDLFEHPRPISRASSATGSSIHDLQEANSAFQERFSMIPFLPPAAAVQKENEALRKRVIELEETLQGCLGLIDP